MIYAAVRAHGRLDVELPHGPDFFQFGTEEKMRTALTEIGFSDVKTVSFEQYWHVKSGAHILHAMRTGSVRARALLAAQSDAAAKGIKKFLEDTLCSMPSPAGGFDVPLPAIIGSGTKS